MILQHQCLPFCPASAILAPMTLHPLYGHKREQERIRRAILEDRLPQGLLLTGPEGIGKQRFALWVAQTLLCEGPERPCGDCLPCRQVLGLTHPDLHWIVPVLRPKATEAEKVLAGKKPDEAAFAEASILAAAATNPSGDRRGATDYKKDMARVLTVRALRKAVLRAGGQ